jgi:RNA polymerase sigma factor (sigma-70 family)
MLGKGGTPLSSAMEGAIANIVKGCIKGERKAQEVLYDLYHKKLYGICLRYTKDADDAKDVLQDAFVKIFGSLGSLKNPEAIEGWVRQIAVRCSINFYNKQMKDRTHERSDQVEPASEDHINILSALNNEEILKCIQILPAGYQMVLNMYVIDGFSHKEIADQLGISENTSKSQLRSAKIKMRMYFEKLGITKYEKAI